MANRASSCSVAVGPRRPPQRTGTCRGSAVPHLVICGYSRFRIHGELHPGRDISQQNGSTSQLWPLLCLLFSPFYSWFKPTGSSAAAAALTWELRLKLKVRPWEDGRQDFCTVSPHPFWPTGGGIRWYESSLPSPSKIWSHNEISLCLLFDWLISSKEDLWNRGLGMELNQARFGLDCTVIVWNVLHVVMSCCDSENGWWNWLPGKCF